MAVDVDEAVIAVGVAPAEATAAEVVVYLIVVIVAVVLVVVAQRRAHVAIIARVEVAVVV